MASTTLCNACHSVVRRAAAPWHCQHCTLYNDASKSCCCSACGLPHQSSTALPPAHGATPPAVSQATVAPEPSYTMTKGAIHALRALLRAHTSVPSRSLPRYALCAWGDHVSQALGVGAHWACGYRNIQMMTSALLQETGEAGEAYRAALFGGCGYVPDVPTLACWIERAWGLGFDPEGAAQMGGRVVGTSKWIGSAEAAALLRSFGIPARLVAFHALDDPTIPLIAPAPIPAAVAAHRAQVQATVLPLLGGCAWEQAVQAGGGKGKGGSKKSGSAPAGQITLSFLSTPQGQGADSGQRHGQGHGPAGAAQARGRQRDEEEDMQAAIAASLLPVSGHDDSDIIMLDDSQTQGQDMQAEDDEVEEVQGGEGGQHKEVVTLLDSSSDEEIEPRGGARERSSVSVSSAPQPPTAAHARPSPAPSTAPTAHAHVSVPSRPHRQFLAARHSALLGWLQRHFGPPGLDCLQEDVHASGSSGSSGSTGGSGSSRPLPLPPYPVYFQHQGHSRTLVGYEVRLPEDSTPAAGKGKGGKKTSSSAAQGAGELGVGRDVGAGPGASAQREPATIANGGLECSLLMLDPSATPIAIKRAVGLAEPAPRGQNDARYGGRNPTWPRVFKRGLHTLRHAQYEAVYVPRGSPVQAVGGIGVDLLKELEQDHVWPLPFS